MPQNATLNLYDYWISDQSAPDAQMPTGWDNLGINKEHQFRFGNADHNPESTPAGSGSINAWTRSTKPYPGVVKNKLANGYPVLAAGHQYDNRDKNKLTSEASLAYLFDSTEFEGKKVYANVDGLVQYEDGYYRYDSRKNYAAYNNKTGNIDLYKKPAVEATGKYSGTGQFFPFNPADDVFQENPDGTLEKKNLKSTDNKMNHYFGAELSVNFTQPKSGTVAGKDMQFHFTGDDDVWLFIDGVLVGDLGGIHGASNLDINFKTGAVTVSDINNKGKTWEPQTTTIRKAFEDALGAQAAAAYLEPNANTLRSDSYHTMKFFYLERGNTDSNMALTFNLQRVTQSTIQKTDQFGQPIAGAEFELWAANKVGNDYAPRENGMIARASTGVSGTLTFMTPDGTRPLDFEEVHANGYDHFILKETKAPEGYRKASDAWLHYVKSKGDGQDGFLKCENPWNSGVYSRPNQVTYVNESNKVWSAGRGQEEPRQFDVTDKVTLLAVIYKHDLAKNDWHPVLGRYGNWSVGNAVQSVEDLNALYRSAAARPFTHEGDAWSVDLGDLPGNIDDYRFMAAQDAKDITYSIGYYLVEMSREELDKQIKAGGNPITAGNAHELESSGERKNFIRESYAKMVVTDQLNTLTVQKVDDAGNPVRGAVFSLYRADQMQKDGQGGLEPKPGAIAFSEQTTKDMTANKAVALDGAACFTGMPIKNQSYGTDTYYLVEKSAPAGYIAKAEPIKILVDWSGVYADAGAKDDGVTVSAGVGSLIDSMDHYGSNDGVEVTLHDVVAEKAMATEVVGSKHGDNFYYVEGWSPTTGGEDEPDLHLRYDDEGSSHEYIENEHKPQDQRHGVMFTADEGVIRANVRQDSEPCTEQHGIGTWDDWDEWPVTNLFTGETVVRVANQRVASFEVEKQVRVPDGLLGPEDLSKHSFTFKVGLSQEGKPLAGEFDARVFKRGNADSEVQVGSDLKVKDGGTFTLRHGETLKVYGVPAGASYKVEEQKGGAAGFEQVEPGSGSGVSGTVSVEKVAHHLFVNEYRPTPAVMPSTVLGVRKDFVSKDGGDPWDLKLDPAPAFEFVLESLTTGAPMPEGSKPDDQGVVKAQVTIDARDEKSGYTEYFAPVRFTHPGTYEYSVHERTPAPQDRIPGVTYSDASYRVKVVVSDDRNGALSAKMSVVKTTDDAGSQLPPDTKPVEPSTPQGDSFIVSFENALERKVAQAGPLASKNLVGRDFIPAPNGAGEFTFRMRPVGKHAASQPMPQAAQGQGEDRFVEVRNNGDAIAFGQSTYTHDDVAAAPYYYELYEVIPAEAVNAEGTRYDQASPEEQARGGFTLNGVIYDSTRYVAEAKLTLVGDRNETVVAEIAYYEGAWSGSVDGLKPVPPSESGANRVWFENTYASSGSCDGIQVTKKLTGRDMQDGEFSFAIEGMDEASSKLLTNADKSFNAPASESGIPVAMGPKLKFSFTQSDAGKTYRFSVSEAVPAAGALPGVAYDKSQYVVEYKIVDNMKGSISVEPTVYRERDAQGDARHEKLDVSALTDPKTGLVSLGFSNTYKASATHAGIEVAKTLTGRDMRAGEFEFRIAPVNEWSAKKMEDRGLTPEDAKAEREFSAGKAANGSAVVMQKLAGLSFDQDDVHAANAATRLYSYDVWEVVDPSWDDNPMAAGVQRRGVTYDRSRFRVTIEPQDTGKGKLKLVTTVERMTDKLTGETLDKPELIGTWVNDKQDSPRVPFENAYAASGSIDTWMPFAKRLEGRDWTEGDSFEFAVEQELYREPAGPGSYIDHGPGEPGYVDAKLKSPIRVDAVSPEHNGSHLFGPSSEDAYTKPGIYRYKMYEVIPDDAINAEGVRYGDATEEQKAAGGFAKDGITYSNRSIHFSISVADYGTGVLSIIPTITDRPEQNGAHFVNRYGSSDASCSLDGLFTKTIEGRDWIASDRFAFELRAESPADAPMPQGSTGGVSRVEVSAKDAVNGTASFGFGSIVYGLDDLADAVPDENGVRSKQFTYKVAEVLPEGGHANGVTFDSHEASVHVTLTDNGKGSLTASPAVVTEAAGSAFVNRYAPAPVTLSLHATKHLEGAPLVADGFQFKLVNTAAPDGVGLSGEQVKSNAADGSVTFDSVAYTRPGQWHYEISEVLPEGIDRQNPVKDGVTYDTRAHKVVVTVAEDREHGVLTATAAYGDGGTQVPPRFENSYSAAPAHADIDVRKTVSPSEGNSFVMNGGEFTFRLVNTDAPKGTMLADPRVASNDAQGAVRFDGLTFPLPGVYAFTLAEEDVKNAPGVSKDGRVYTIAYEVEDNGMGQLVVRGRHVSSTAGEVVDQAAPLEFDNAYDPQSVAYEISGSKRIDAADPGATRLPEDGEFSFTLKALGATLSGGDVPADEVPMPAGSAGATKTVVNMGEGFSFGAMTYDAPGTYRYAVHEEAGSDASIVYDGASYTVEVVVEDSDGKLSAHASIECDGEQADEVSFVNVYTPLPSTPIALGGGKTLTGRDLIDGEFAFTLTAQPSESGGETIPANAVPMPAGSEGASKTVVNEGDAFSFGDITYDRTGAYRYEVREVAGSAGGVSYDHRVYTVTVRVVQDLANRCLTASASYSIEGGETESITFENSYTPAPATLRVGACKQLIGRDLKDGEFSFAMLVSGPNGSSELRTENDSSGLVWFPQVTFSACGAYDIEVFEVAGNRTDTVYDDSVFKGTVEVVDPGDGQLKVGDIAWENGARPVFVNRAVSDAPLLPQPGVKPNEPMGGTGGGNTAGRLPSTGDAMPAFVLLGIVGMCAAVWGFARRSKRA